MTRLVAALALAAAATGCGYRIVRRDDVTAQRFARDSTARATLEHQVTTLRAQCHQDSVRLSAELASLRAQPVVPTATDSLVRARDAEIAMLRDQLTKANAELDRIKRRLATPRP